MLKVSHGNFWYIQTGRRSLIDEKFELFLTFLPQDLQLKYREVVEIKSKNWGAQKGGNITFQKHPEQIVKARNLAHKKIKERANSQFDINQQITIDIAEFLGAFSGDGCSNVYSGHHFTSFAGDSRYDWKYYHERIIPTTKKYFNVEHQTIRKRGNCMWVTIHSKLLHKMITERFKMPAGEKWNKVLVPEEIMEGKLEHKLAFVRGAFDTDGCVFFDKRPTYKEPYMRVDITMVNVPILTQLNQILTEAGVPSKVLGNGKHLHVTSKKDVRKFFEIIGSSNERHISKIETKYPDFRSWNPAFSRENPSTLLTH
ncbi:MAG: LAGLIDADG family homing endonuclease [archaeon]